MVNQNNVKLSHHRFMGKTSRNLSAEKHRFSSVGGLYMPKFRFNEIAINSTEKKKPVEEDKFTYIGLEHLILEH
jgi:hypothetical protein